MNPSRKSMINSGGRLTRKDFLFVLGAGAAAIISGHFLIGNDSACPSGITGDGGEGAVPKGRGILRKDPISGYWVLTAGAGTSECVVNQIGARVIGLLDGCRRIEEIANTLAYEFGLTDSESLRAKVAGFVAQLGQAGFLEGSYYACIYEEEVSA